MTIHLTDFLIIVVTVFLPVVATAMARYFQLAGQPQKVRALQQWASLAVSAAEEYGRKLPPGEGARKLRYATDTLKNTSSKTGVRLTDQQASRIVEGVLNDVRPFITLEGGPDEPGSDATRA